MEVGYGCLIVLMCEVVIGWPCVCLFVGVVLVSLMDGSGGNRIVHMDGFGLGAAGMYS